MYKPAERIIKKYKMELIIPKNQQKIFCLTAKTRYKIAKMTAVISIQF
jgi:hypothetical protein